jgi:PAS domain S-box-containing protein
MTRKVKAMSFKSHEEMPWQALLDSAGEGIWGVDLEGRCTFVNRAALAMLGFTAEELIGQNMHDLIHHHYPDGSPYPGSECVIYHVFLKSKPFTNRIDHLFRKDGSLFWSEMSAQPILHNGMLRGAVVTFRDITQIRLTEEALRRNEKLAAVGQLASSIAHEINNPLEAVTNLLYLMRNAKSLDEMRRYASLAEAELARVAEITSQTLSFHRHQTKPKFTDIRAMLVAILGLHETRVKARQVEVKLDLRDIPAIESFDGDIRQVMNNLVRNAYEAMARGGRLSIRLKPRISRAGVAGVLLTIADDGSGIPHRIRQNLFEPFQTSKEATGTGLGLWISKSIVDEHGGMLQVKSKVQAENAPQHGTVFQLWLPESFKGKIALS